MDLDKYISNYSLENVLKIEYMDKQFLVLKEVWEKIKKMNLIKSEQKKELFLFLILQNALVSYQIAGGGELWWQEFANKIESDFITLSELFVNGKSNTDRWYSFLTSSKYNKRIYNIKIARLRKFDVFLGLKNNTMFDYYHNMESLLTDVCMVMGAEKFSKTMVFAVKMFGYGARIVIEKFIPYPMSIGIPVDSRIRKIYELGNSKSLSDKQIYDYFHGLAHKYGIPPLHLDSLLWVKR